jgi:hypothetical protein
MAGNDDLPDIIPLGPSADLNKDYREVFDPDTGMTVRVPIGGLASRRPARAGADANVTGFGTALGDAFVRSWQGESQADLAGDLAAILSKREQISKLQPLSLDETLELSKLTTSTPTPVMPSGPYMNFNSPSFQAQARIGELRARQNRDTMLAQLNADLEAKTAELKEVNDILAQHQGTTFGKAQFDKAQGFGSSLGALVRNPLDVLSQLSAESSWGSAKAAGIGMATTAATVATGGGALLAGAAGLGATGLATGMDSYDGKLLEELIKKNPEVIKDPKGYVEAYKKNPSDYEKAYREAQKLAIKVGIAEGGATAAMGGLTKLIPGGKTLTGKIASELAGEVSEEVVTAQAVNAAENKGLLSPADAFKAATGAIAGVGTQGPIMAGVGKAGGAIADAFKPSMQVDAGTLTPMAPRPFSLMPQSGPTQMAVDLNTLTPTTPVQVGPQPQLFVNPSSLTPAGPSPDIIPLGSPQAGSQQAGADAGALPDIIPLSPPTAQPVAASRNDQAQPAQQSQPAQPTQPRVNPLAPVSAPQGGGAGEPVRANTNVVPREKMRAPRAGFRFIEVDPRLVNDEHQRTSPSWSVRNPENELSRGGVTRTQLAKNYIQQGKFDDAEAAEVAIADDGKLFINNGRHRLLAAEQLGAPTATIQVPEDQADELSRRFAPRSQAGVASAFQPQATQPTAPTLGQQPQAAPTQAQGQRPVSLAPVNNTNVTNPQVGMPSARPLSVRDQAAWDALEKKGVELDRRRAERRAKFEKDTNPATRRRGNEQVAQSLVNGLRRGGNISHKEATAALRIVERLMERGYLDNLAVSISDADRGGGVRGEYNEVAELLKLFVRNNERPGILRRTFAHEVSHHLERMIPAKDLEAARQQFLRERAQWLKDKQGLRQLLGEGNWLDKSFTNEQIKQFLASNTMNPALISQYFIRDTKNGNWRIKLTDETYQFTNFSEYFAEKVAGIAVGRDDARYNPQSGPGVWAKIKDMLAEIKKALMDVFSKDEVEAIWDRFQEGEYTSDFKRDKLQGYDKTGGQNPVMDDPRTADYRNPRFGDADKDRQERVNRIDKLEPNKVFSTEDQSKIDDMRFAGESILEESAGEEEGVIAARRDEQVSMSNVEKDAKKSGKIAGATLYISSRMLEGMSFDDAFGEVVSKYGKSFSKFRDVIQQTTDRIAGLPVSEAFDEAEKLASTRYPMAVGALEDPNKRNLISGLATILADPEKTKKSARELRKITGFKSDKSWDDQRVISEFIKHVEGNLDWLYKGMRDRLPEGILDRSKLWYVGANAIANRLAKKHSIPVEAAAGVLAVLSPQMDWYKNVSLAERALEIVVNKKNHVVDDAMVEAIMKRPSMVKLFMAIHEKKIYGDNFKQKATKWPNKGDFKKDSEAAKALQEKLMAQAVPILRKSGVIPVGTKMGEIKDARLYAYLLRAYDEAYNPREYAVITPEGGTAGMSMNEENTKMNDIGWGNFDIIEKVRPLVESPTMENISRLMGGEHKVRNFYNNIIAPNADLGQVTIDTHAVAAALLEPLAGSDKEVDDNLGATGGSDYTGLSGLYPIYAQAYQNAAKKYGLLPREMQSITWEGVRGLFTNKFKNATNKATIRGHWADYASGKISLATARSKIEKTAGGFKPPTWYGRDGQSPEGVGSAQDQGNVDPRGVREGRGRPGPGGARKGSGGSSVKSARDDGENTPIPGGYREAFFQAKKGAGAPEPKQIKWWTDVGHDFDADPAKQFLWAIDKVGKMHVVSVSDLRDLLHEYGYEDRFQDSSESRDMSKNEGVTHLDWESLAQFGEMEDTAIEGVNYDLLKGPAHGRIDATGDVVRLSMVQKGQQVPAMKADMRDYVKGKLAEHMGMEAGDMRGYDFTDAGPFNGPEVFSARDEEGADVPKPSRPGSYKAFDEMVTSREIAKPEGMPYPYHLKRFTVLSPTSKTARANLEGYHLVQQGSDLGPPGRDDRREFRAVSKDVDPVSGKPTTYRILFQYAQSGSRGSKGSVFVTITDDVFDNVPDSVKIGLISELFERTRQAGLKDITIDKKYAGEMSPEDVGLWGHVAKNEPEISFQGDLNTYDIDKNTAYSARDDDGENTVIPGGNREAFFDKKSGVPEPKRIKYYTDIGHPTEGQDKNKFFLWAIDDRGKLRVRSVAEVEQMVQQTGKDPEGMFVDEDEATHSDWFHHSSETGKDGYLRDTETMGRIDASGDVIRISYGSRGTDGKSDEINVEARDNVKRMLADYLRQKPENIRGYDFTKNMKTGADPEVFSARDEEPSQRQLKADPVVRGNPEEDVSLPMDRRSATYPKGEDFTREGSDGSVEAYNILGRNKASPERMRQIQEFVKNSKVKHALYRGQNGAYEKPSTFLARDGLIHLTDDPDYAAQYAESPGKRVPEEGTKSAIAQVYLNAENILDLSKFGHTISDKNASTKIPQLAESIYGQIVEINGGEIPGLRAEILDALKTEFLDHDDGFDTEGLTGGNVWRALIPLEKVVGVFDLGVHAIKYSDSDVRTARGEKRGGKVSYAINDPSRIKAAFGDNDVNPDTGNIFQSARDEDGDYRGSHRAPDGTNGEGSMDAMDRTYPDDIYGPKGAQYYGARRPDDVKIHKLIQSVRGNPDAMVTVYRAVPKGVGAEITPGNWVSPSREYAAEHGERFPNGYEVLERQVRAGDLFTEGNSLQEFGWNPTGEPIQSARDEDTTDIPSSGSTARKAGLAAGALALAPTTLEAATGAAKTGGMIAGVAVGDLIGVASGIAFASNDRLLKGLNPIAANMHLLANDTRSPTVRRIAEMFNRLGGNTSAGAQETYHDERDANRRIYRNKLSAAFEPLAKLSQDQLRALDVTIARALAGEIPMPSGPVGQVVKNLQALSDELYRYLREAGIDVNYAKDYAIPHSFNAEAVAKDEQAFINLAEQAYIDNNPKRINRLQAYIQQIDQEAAQNGGFTQEMTDRKNALNEEINKLQVANPRQQAEDLAAAIMAGEEGGDQSQGLILGSSPSNQNRADFLKDRVFEQSARAMLRDYFQNDPRHAWNNYIARATTLAEFSRRFGSKGETWMKLVDQMRKEGVKEKDITRIKEHVLDAMGALTPAAQGSHAMANALLGLLNMSKLRSTFLTNFLEAQAQAIPGNLTDAVTAPVVMLKEFAAILAELSPRQRALVKQYLRVDLSTETGNMELARIVGLMDAAGVHQIMENSAYALDRQGEFREDSKMDRTARAVSGATSNIARAYGIEASENAKRAMGARYAAGRLDQHVSDFLRDNILARALKKVGYTGDAMTTRNEAIMRLRRAGLTDQQMIAFGTWWETARNSNNFNERLADTTDPMAAIARKAIRMEASRAMVNSNRAMKPGGERNKAISQDNFWGKAVMSFLNYPAAFREQVAKPMGRDIASGFRGYESEGGQSTFFSPAERARLIARASAIPAMAISAAAFLAARVMIGGDEEEKEKAGEKSLLSWLIDGLSYTGLLGGKTEAVQRARRGQLPPIIDEGVRLAKNINREGTEGNGKERAVTKSAVNMVGVPALELAATKLPMPLATAADQIIASRQFKEMVVDEVAGKKQEKKTGGSTSRGSGREDGRSGGRSDGR